MRTALTIAAALTIGGLLALGGVFDKPWQDLIRVLGEQMDGDTDG